MISSGFPTWRGRPIPLTRKAIEDEIERLIAFWMLQMVTSTLRTTISKTSMSANRPSRRSLEVSAHEHAE